MDRMPSRLKATVLGFKLSPFRGCPEASKGKEKMSQCLSFKSDGIFPAGTDDLRSPGTMRAYHRLYKDYMVWCVDRQLEYMPSSYDTVGRYLLSVASRYRINSIENIVSAISFAHHCFGYSFSRQGVEPIVRAIGRVHGIEELRTPGIQNDYLRKILDYFPETNRGIRDRAIFLIAFAAGLTANELVGLDYSTRGKAATGVVEMFPDSASITLSQPGTAHCRARETTKIIRRRQELCPVAALEAWVGQLNLTSGPIFRPIDRWDRFSEARMLRNGMAGVVKRAIFTAELAAGNSPERATQLSKFYSFRSLRIGFIVSALEAGVSAERIAIHLGWTTTQMVLQYKVRYLPLLGNPLMKIMC